MHCIVYIPNSIKCIQYVGDIIDGIDSIAQHYNELKAKVSLTNSKLSQSRVSVKSGSLWVLEMEKASSRQTRHSNGKHVIVSEEMS